MNSRKKWTEKLGKSSQVAKKVPGKKPERKLNRASRSVKNKALNEAELLFWHQVYQSIGITGCCPEYEFATELGRKWRWDFAWPDQRIAVEIDGGIWTRGAHGDPQRILDNMEKRNHGALLGWRVLSFTPQQVLKSTHAIDFTRRVLSSRASAGTSLVRSTG